ncbi:protein EVI2A [Gracilinanus agilis]|uniref:protein EVI2A n=1 Tax=Gracilinanus agilis TaxID=191870 RepID=UPI001CFE20D3|nr:protein EVI2A [Gracilinanus agilis]
MEPPGLYLHAALLATTIFSWIPQVKAKDEPFWAINSTAWDGVIQNKTNGSLLNPETPEPVTVYPPNVVETRTPRAPPPSPSLVPPTGHHLDTPPSLDSSTGALPSTDHPGRGQDDVLKRDICEEGNNKMAMLVCLVIIAVLFLICTLLFLSTVILANRVSSLKRSKQVYKRQTRSNGDFLATSGLWPADSDTLKRAEQLQGPRLIMQATGTLTAQRERKEDGATEKLAP